MRWTKGMSCAVCCLLALAIASAHPTALGHNLIESHVKDMSAYTLLVGYKSGSVTEMFDTIRNRGTHEPLMRALNGMMLAWPDYLCDWCSVQ